MKRKIISWILVVCWMTVIFSFSAQNAKKSNAASGRVIRAVVKVVYLPFNKLSESEQKEIISSLQVVVRKTAHATEYFILAVLVFFAINKRKKAGYLLTELICVLYAVTDEIHQLFVDNRACRFFDVCIDGIGSFAALLLIFLIIRKISAKKNNITEVLL